MDHRVWLLFGAKLDSERESKHPTSQNQPDISFLVQLLSLKHMETFLKHLSVCVSVC